MSSSGDDHDVGRETPDCVQIEAVGIVSILAVCLRSGIDSKIANSERSGQDSVGMKNDGVEKSG